MPANYKIHKLLAEKYDPYRNLGLKTPQNLGILSDRPETKPEMDENMKFDMKHMRPRPEDMQDDEDQMMKRDSEIDDEEDVIDDEMDDDTDDLGVDDDNDLESAEDDEIGDDTEMSDEDEMEDDEDDDLDAMMQGEIPVGRAHDSSAFMKKNMSEGKKMPPWMKDKEDDKKMEKMPKKDNEKKVKKDKSEDNCKKCSSEMKESKEFARKIAEQFKPTSNKKYFSGVIEEDLLLPSKEEVVPGDPGHAPSTRIGEFNPQALAESLDNLNKRLDKLEKKLNKLG